MFPQPKIDRLDEVVSNCGLEFLPVVVAVPLDCLEAVLYDLAFVRQNFSHLLIAFVVIIIATRLS